MASGERGIHFMALGNRMAFFCIFETYCLLSKRTSYVNHYLAGPNMRWQGVVESENSRAVTAGSVALQCAESVEPDSRLSLSTVLPRHDLAGVPGTAVVTGSVPGIPAVRLLPYTERRIH